MVRYDFCPKKLHSSFFDGGLWTNVRAALPLSLSPRRRFHGLGGCDGLEHAKERRRILSVLVPRDCSISHGLSLCFDRSSYSVSCRYQPDNRCSYSVICGYQPDSCGCHLCRSIIEMVLVLCCHGPCSVDVAVMPHYHIQKER